MPNPRYIEVNLDTHETVVPVPPLDYGVTLSPDMKPIVTLPGAVVDCHGEADERGRHGDGCWCHGTGTLPIKTQTDIEPVDAADDGHDAMMAALAARDAATEESVDPYLGAPIAQIIKRDVANRTSSGTGRKAKKIDPRRIAQYDPHPSVEDGRVEIRRGRPPKHGETRRVKIRVSIEPSVVNLLEASDGNIADIAEMMLADEAFRAEIEAARQVA